MFARETLIFFTQFMSVFLPLSCIKVSLSLLSVSEQCWKQLRDASDPGEENSGPCTATCGWFDDGDDAPDGHCYLFLYNRWIIVFLLLGDWLNQRHPSHPSHVRRALRLQTSGSPLWQPSCSFVVNNHTLTAGETKVVCWERAARASDFSPLVCKKKLLLLWHKVPNRITDMMSAESLTDWEDWKNFEGTSK